jgi:hypothetical protein
MGNLTSFDYRHFMSNLLLESIWLFLFPLLPLFPFSKNLHEYLYIPWSLEFKSPINILSNSWKDTYCIYRLGITLRFWPLILFRGIAVSNGGVIWGFCYQKENGLDMKLFKKTYLLIRSWLWYLNKMKKSRK